MDVFSRSYLLTKQSLAVLAKDKELLLFPVVSGICLIVFLLILIAPVVLIGPIKQFVFDAYIVTFIEEKEFVDWKFYLFLYILAFITNLIGTFFNTGLVFCVHKRLNGGDPTFWEGIKTAFKFKGKIIIWAAFTASIGIILTVLKERLGWLARFGISIVQVAWSLITYFIVPVLIFENLSLKDSISKSGKLFKSTWGENITFQISNSLVFGILALTMIPIFLILFVFGLKFIPPGSNLVWYNIISFSVLVISWILLWIISSTLDGIFRVALYQYAVTGKVPQEFSEQLIKDAFKHSGKSNSS